MDDITDYPWVSDTDGSFRCTGHCYRMSVVPSPSGTGVVARAELLADLVGVPVLERPFVVDYNAISWLESLDILEFGSRLKSLCELEDILHFSASHEELDVMEALCDQVESFLHAVVTHPDGVIHVAEKAGGSKSVCGVEGSYARYLSKSFFSQTPGFCRSCAEWIGFDVDEPHR